MVLNSIEILIIFIAGILVGGFAPSWFRGRGGMGYDQTEEKTDLPQLKAPNLLKASSSSLNLIARQKERKDANKHAIMGAFAWVEGGRLTGADVEKMLGVSDSTAARYLDELIAEGKVRKEIGDDKRVRYVKMS